MIFLYALLLWIGLVNLFVAAMHAKAVLARGEKIHITFLAPLYVGAAVGLVLDIVFNLTIGSLIYRELPHELTFSARCSKHFRSAFGWRYQKARWWAQQLNAFDRGHIA